jgi:hypothetical protein
MTEAAAAPSTPRKRAKRTPSLGVETQSITIDLPKDMYKRFEAAANAQLLPLKLFVVRELAGLNAKAAPIAIGE